MATDTSYGCGISRSGSPGSYTYSPTKNGNYPVNYVSWGDAARFCNWLQNGQPTSGTEGTGTTETGAYTLNGATSNALLMSITRNAEATYFIPTENEWYKAAYYSGGGTNSAYWTYPTKSNVAPGNTLPDLGNNANFYLSNYTDPTNYLTPSAHLWTRPAPMGRSTWAATFGSGMRRISPVRFGGCVAASGTPLQLLGVLHPQRLQPDGREHDLGFRVASVPEPGSLTLLLVCAVAFGIWRQRRNA